MSRALRRDATVEEAALWQILRAGRLDGHRFRRQQVIDGFIVDFYCHAACLVIELDGLIHEHQREYDDARDRVLSARGLRILRVLNGSVNADLGTVIAEIRRLLSSPPRAGEGPGER